MFDRKSRRFGSSEEHFTMSMTGVICRQNIQERIIYGRRLIEEASTVRGLAYELL